MPTGAQTPGPDQPQRRIPRYQVQAPLDVTVLRRGIPYTLPGRSLNLCERGIAAVLAGEVSPGEAVGLELQLPLAPGPLRTHALVRHHDRLRCGMEFVGLTPEQLSFLRQWVEQSHAKPDPGGTINRIKRKPPRNAGTETPQRTGREISSGGSSARPSKTHRGAWILWLMLAAVLLAVLWWRWNLGWQEIESGQTVQTSPAEAPQVRVSAEIMEKLLTHRVEPEYPEAARAQKLEGIVVLRVVIGRDGTVVSLVPLSGPDVLTHAAMDALRWWRFQPYQINGQPVTVETELAVEFHP